VSRTVVIANPTSRSGATGRRLSELERLLRRHVGDFRLLCTRREGDARLLAQAALASGATRLVVAGGDGTLGEVASGLLSIGAADRAEIVPLPLGSGGDLARGLGLGRDLAAAVRRLESGTRRKIDVGRLELRDAERRVHARWFLNIASFGMSGEAMLWLAEQGRLGRRGRLSYVESGLRSLLAYRAPDVRVRVDGRLAYEGKVLLGVVANGPYFGAGMHVAPYARLDDGQFDLVLVKDLPKTSAVALIPSLFLGRHLRDGRIEVLRGKRVQLESVHEVWLEADGEPVGLLPIEVELLPSSLTLAGLP
jgi:YegS/Rv2252/BmrU family lipid kinase